MPLQWQRQMIPMLGVDESTDPRMMTVDKLLVCENGTFRDGKAIRKRNGFTPLPRMLDDSFRTISGTTDSDGAIGAARSIFSTGEELCVVGKTRLYGLPTGWDKWQDRGPVSPCAAKATTVFRDATDHGQCDMDVSGEYVCYAARRSYREFSTLNKHAIELVVRTTNGQLVTPPALSYIDSASAINTQPHSPRVCHYSGGFRAYWAQGAQGAGAATQSVLRRADYSLKSQKWTAAGSHNTNLYDNSAAGVAFDHPCRHFDAIGLDRTSLAGGHCVAWIDHTTRKTTVEIYDSSGALVSNQLLGNSETEKHYLVALCESSGSDSIYVLVAQDAGAELTADGIFLYKLRGSDLFLQAGPVSMDALGSDPKERATNISVSSGIVTGNVGSAAPDHQPTIGASWGTYIVDSGVSTWAERARTKTRAVIESGMSLGLLSSLYNCLPWSRTWFHGGRCYQWLQTCIAQMDPDHPDVALNGTGKSIAFEAHFMIDCFSGQSNPVNDKHVPAMVGLHSVGTAPPFLDGGFATARLPYVWSHGNCSTVARWPGTNDYRHAVVALSAAESTEDRRHEVLEVSCDFDAPVSVAIFARGAAVIGGSCVMWYAGDFTEELGFAVPPMIAVQSTAETLPLSVDTAGGSLPFGTYTYQAIWESYDGRGYYHRSHPSTPVQHALSGGTNDTVRHKFICSPATNRTNVPGREMSAHLYRAAADGVFSSCQRPMGMVPNDVYASYLTTTLDDDGKFITGGVGTGVPLYTNGGAELENVAPEGAQLVTIAGDRLWLAGMVRRERAQYSKGTSVVTATEDARAPEMNEGFGLAVPDGSEAVGVASLDDKVIIFSSQRIYAIAGAGPDDAGGDSDFSQLTPINSDGGCIDGRSIVSTKLGVFFRHPLGIYLLDRGMSVSFIGDKVRRLTDKYSTVTSGVVVPEHAQIRFTCNSSDGLSGIVLVYDYTANAWSHWSVKPRGRDVAFAGACMHGGVYHVVTTDGAIYREDATTWRDDGEFRPLVIETAWAQSAGQSGWQRMRKVVPLLESREPHGLKVSIARNFADEFEQAAEWTGAQVGAFKSPEQVSVRIGAQKGHAFKVRVEDTDPGFVLASTGEGYTIAGITLEFGVKRGGARFGKNQAQ